MSRSNRKSRCNSLQPSIFCSQLEMENRVEGTVDKNQDNQVANIGNFSNIYMSVVENRQSFTNNDLVPNGRIHQMLDVAEKDGEYMLTSLQDFTPQNEHEMVIRREGINCAKIFGTSIKAIRGVFLSIHAAGK